MDAGDNTENPTRDKICLVCGDKALGYNFNAITCESCKAFFRRNALKDKPFKCPFNKKCEINTITRRFCQLCRLIKCFEIGMKKEYIMSENDKREKRKKIEQRRECRSDEDKFAIGETSEDEKHPKRFKSDALKEEFRENPLSLASSSNITYAKRPTQQCSTVASVEQIPYPSPLMPEPSSPVGSSVTDARTVSSYDSNHSRSAEIYQLSKATAHKKVIRSFQQPPPLPKSPETPVRSDSSIIQNILSADHRLETQREIVDCVSEERPSRSTSNNYLDSHPTSSRSIDSHLPPSTSRPMPLLSSLVSGNEQTSQDRSYHSNVADEVLRDIPSRKARLELGNSIESILSEAIKLEYEAYSSMNPRINSRELNDAERAKLNELIVANKALLAPLEDDISSLMAQEAMSKVHQSNLGLRPMLVDVLNLTAVAIRRLIKMSKKVNAFKNMCQEDQVALLKGGCTEMMILRSAMIYDSDRGSWKIPHGKESLMNIKVDVLKEAGGRVFEEHQRFLQTFDLRWRQDENIMLILSAITLFTPDRPRVVHYDVIKLEQNSYYYLLRRYLESIYPGCEARSTFLKLIQKIAELHRLNEDHVRVYMELNPQDVEPLLIEIFDLNPSRGQ